MYTSNSVSLGSIKITYKYSVKVRVGRHCCQGNVKSEEKNKTHKKLAIDKNPQFLSNANETLHNGHSRYQNLNLTCWFSVSGVKIISVWNIFIHYFINFVIFSIKIGISNLTFLVDFPNDIYFYTSGSYVRHQKSSISENPSKSAVREYYQMKYIAYADMVVYELLR